MKLTPEMPYISIKTFGCKVNLCDSEALARRLRALGADVGPVREGPVDAVLVNTCAVTERALKKAGKYLRALARTRPGIPVAVFGCGPSYGEVLPELENMAHFPRGSEEAAVRFLLEALGLRQPSEPETRNPKLETLDGRQVLGRTRAFVKIADGCNGSCSYCVVPQLRGPLRSRPLFSVLREAFSLARGSHREIVLTAIHLGKYGSDLETPDTLADVVRSVGKLRGVERVRLSSIEAGEVDAGLLGLAGDPVLAPHLHLPLQSGDAGILKKMRRPYTPEAFLAKLREVRSRFETVAVTTDVIVGFPGESEAAFEETLRVCREARFSRIHAFPYSPRKGTPASLFPGRVPVVETRRRIAALIETGKGLADEFRLSRIGARDRVLVEKAALDRPGFVEGLDGSYQRVILPGAPEDLGELIPVRITGVEGEFCLAAR